MKPGRKFLLILFPSLIALSILTALYIRGAGVTEIDSKSLRTVQIARGNIEEIVTAQGTLEPKNYVDVGAQVSGQLTKLYVDVGDSVKQGELLAEIDPRVYESRVEADAAELKNLQAQLAEAESEQILARQKHERNERLIKIDAVSEQSVEISESELKVAIAKIDALKAEIDAAQSTLDEDKANLEYTKIYAPMTGTVVSLTTREGQTVNSMQTAPTILSIADLDEMTVTAEVAEADILRVKEGMSVYFMTLGNLEDKREGAVRLIEPSPEVVNDVVLYHALIDVDNRDRSLMNGMTTQVFFVIGRASDVPIIPVAALTERAADKDNEKGQAYLVRTSGAEGETQLLIHVGLRDRNYAEITDGLSEGENIVITESGAGNAAASKQNGSRRMGPPPML